MTDNDRLAAMAAGTWRGCRCGVPVKQTADSVKIPTEHGVNWQIPMACPQCGTKQRLTMLILDGESLAKKYAAWKENMLPPPQVNLQPNPASKILT